MARLSRSQPDKTGFGKAGSSKGPKNQSSGKSASKKSLPKKPMKVKKPRPETRDLIRWNDDLDTQVLLAINVACHNNNIKIPWDDVGTMLDTTMLVSGSAIIQHMAKIRSRRVAANLPVPPAIQRGGGYRKVNNTGNMKTVKSNASNSQTMANMYEESDEDFDFEREDSDQSFGQSRQAKRKRNDNARELREAQWGTPGEQYNTNFENKVVGRVKMEPESDNIEPFVAVNAKFLKLDDDYSERDYRNEMNDGAEDSDIGIHGEGDQVEMSESSDEEGQQIAKILVLKVGMSKRAQAVLRKYEQPLVFAGAALDKQGIKSSSSLYGTEGSDDSFDSPSTRSAYHVGSAYERASAYVGDFADQGTSQGKSAYQQVYAYPGGSTGQVGTAHQAYFPNAYSSHGAHHMPTNFNAPMPSTIAPSGVPSIAGAGMDSMLFTANEKPYDDNWAINWNDPAFDMWDN